MIHPRNRHFQKHSQDRIGLHQLRLIRNRFPHTEVQLQLHTRERNRIASHQEIVQQDLNKKIFLRDLKILLGMLTVFNFDNIQWRTVSFPQLIEDKAAKKFANILDWRGCL